MKIYEYQSIINESTIKVADYCRYGTLELIIEEIKKIILMVN